MVRESGLPNRTDSMFTTVEGDWDECMDVVKRACQVVGRYGSRVSLVLKADIRPGQRGSWRARWPGSSPLSRAHGARPTHPTDATDPTDPTDPAKPAVSSGPGR